MAVMVDSLDTMTDPDTEMDTAPVEESLQYQPQADLQQPAETLTELKPVKQSVTYDSSTGKMYAELGSGGTNRQLPSNPENNNYSFSSYPTPQTYSGYPVMSPTPQYTSSYSSPGNYTSSGAPLPPPPYAAAERNTSYPFSTGPGAFLPHSAINLSVKTEETNLNGQPQTASDPSPQILDLTRPLR